MARHQALVPHDRRIAPVPHSPSVHAAPAASDARIDPGAIWAIVVRGKWFILGSVAVMLGLAAFYSYSADPVYRASAVVAVEAQPQGTVALLDLAGPNALAAEVGLLRNSLEIAERVVGRLEGSATAMGTAEHFPLLVAAGPDSLSRAPSRRLLARALLARVSFTPADAERVIHITVESTAPAEASQIANLYAEEYAAYAQETSRASVVAAREFLEAQVEERREELADVEGAWAGFAQREGIVAQGARGEQLVAEHAGLVSRRDAVQFEIDQEQTQLRILQNQLSQVEPEVRDVVERERQAARLENEVAAHDSRLAELSIAVEEYYAVNPSLRGNESSVPELGELSSQLRRLRERRDELSGQLIEERHRISQASIASAGGQLDYVARLKERILEKDMGLRSLNAERSALSRRLGGASGRISRVPGQIVVQDQLARRRDQLERWSDTFDAQLQDLRMAEASELGYVTPVRAAAVPVVPVRPNPPQNMMLGGLLGLGIGLALAFGRAAADRRLREPDSVRERGHYLLGVIPNMRRILRTEFKRADTIEVDGRRLSTRMLTALSPWSLISEHFRLLRVRLEADGGGAVSGVLLVTSPEPGDGKTTVASNLAVTLAQAGYRTLLLDTDLHHPTAHTLLGEPLAPGLSTLLCGESHELPIRRVADRLDFIAAGPQGAVPPAELLHSQVMTESLEALRQQYDVVIVDAPPVLLASDAIILAQRADAVLLVASADQTDLRALEAAQETLEAVGASLAGVLLNRYEPERSRSNRYPYGYGYADETKRPSRPALMSPSSGVHA